MTAPRPIYIFAQGELLFLKEIPIATQTLAKQINELSILTMLRTHGNASRADIARQLAVTPATITRLVSTLIERNIVYEAEEGMDPAAQRDVGRPAKSIALNPNGAFFLGVEIGVGIIRCVLLDLSVSVVDSFETEIARSITPGEAVRVITGYFAKLQIQPRFAGKIRSLCVTVPGLVSSKGFIDHLAVLGWENVSLLPELYATTGLPCFTENNADAAAFGSFYTRNASFGVCTIYLKVGSGCGGAVIINGRLLRGSSGTACELGHIPLTETGARCHAGHTGCLESWVNLNALARLLGKEDLTESQLAELPALTAKAAAAGGETAREAVRAIAHYLARGISALINIFNPTTIILGGAMIPIFEYGLDQIRAGISGGLVPGIPLPEIQLSQLGLFECAIGAACIAHHKAFDLSNIDLTESAP
ncbi:MAG: ROK family protein [Treponema sp.]|nr:ROK family protein [Treponema sp.]